MWPEDSMVYVNAFLKRVGSNSRLWVYIDQAIRARRRAITTSDAVLESPFAL